MMAGVDWPVKWAQVVMTKSQLADYSWRVMDGAVDVRRNQCDEEWDVQYKNGSEG